MKPPVSLKLYGKNTYGIDKINFGHPRIQKIFNSLLNSDIVKKIDKSKN